MHQICTVEGPVGSEMGIPRGTRKRDGIADIVHAGDIIQQAFEAQPKARVGYRAIAPQIPVPLQFTAEPMLGHALIQRVTIIGTITN